MPGGRSNFLLLMVDQMRHDQVGWASGGHFVTPNLDRLAAGGCTFDAAYSASTTCVPSRVALLTGVHPHRPPTQQNHAALLFHKKPCVHELVREERVVLVVESCTQADRASGLVDLIVYGRERSFREFLLHVAIVSLDLKCPRLHLLQHGRKLILRNCE